MGYRLNRYGGCQREPNGYGRLRTDTEEFGRERKRSEARDTSSDANGRIWKVGAMGYQQKIVLAGRAEAVRGYSPVYVDGCPANRKTFHGNVRPAWYRSGDTGPIFWTT